MRISTVLVGLIALGCQSATAPDAVGTWGGREASLRLDRAELLTERFVGHRGFIVRMGLSAAAVSRADSLPPSEALRFGGAANLRGFADESFAARRYAAGQLEVGPAWPEARAYLFLDAAV